MIFENTYPEFPDSKVDLYEHLATQDIQDRLDYEYSFETINPKPADVVLSTSLFAKPPDQELEPINVPEDLDRLHPSIRRGETTWMDAFPKRLEEAHARLKTLNLGWTVRVYLARDLEFLIPRLLEMDVEIRLMRSSSILHNPGACWRFLAADDSEIFFARDCEDLCPTDFEKHALLRFIDEARRGGDPLMFRMIYNWDYDDEATVYRPVSANFVGGHKLQTWGLGRALKAWDWCGSREVPEDTPRRPRSNFLPKKHFHPVLGERDLFGMRWPRYGGDEQFGGQWLYWKACKSGMLHTVIGTSEEGYHGMLVDDLSTVLH